MFHAPPIFMARAKIEDEEGEERQIVAINHSTSSHTGNLLIELADAIDRMRTHSH